MRKGPFQLHQMFWWLLSEMNMLLLIVDTQLDNSYHTFKIETDCSKDPTVLTLPFISASIIQLGKLCHLESFVVRPLCPRVEKSLQKLEESNYIKIFILKFLTPHELIYYNCDKRCFLWESILFLLISLIFSSLCSISSIVFPGD